MARAYEILGVDKNASQKEIKSAFRNLAKKYHPDINKEPDAAKRFAEISQAYELMKENDIYTEIGSRPNSYQPPPNRPRPTNNRPYQWNPKDFAGSSSSFYEDIFEDILRGKSDWFKNEFRKSYQSPDEEFRRNEETSKKQRPRSKDKSKESVTIKIPLEVAYAGGEATVIHKNNRFKIIVPKKSKDESVILHENFYTKYIVKLKIDLSNTDWTIHGNNLHKIEKINWYDAILGKEMKLELPDGKIVPYDMKAGIKFNTELLLTRQGFDNGDIKYFFQFETPKLNSKTKIKFLEFLDLYLKEHNDA